MKKINNNKYNIGLCGFTGFVGSNILNQFAVDVKYNSKNIAQIQNKEFELLIISSIPAVKWYANLRPELDLQIINEQLELYKSVKANKVVIISTIDVYDDFTKCPDEDYVIDESKLDYYGKHRLFFEKEMRKQFANVSVLRLPALFGKGLKKNFIYDLNNKAPKMLNEEKYNEISEKINDKEKNILNSFYKFEKNSYILNEDKYFDNKKSLDQIFEKVDFSALKFTDENSAFPYYNLDNIKKDIDFVIDNNIDILNTAVEIITSKEIVKHVYNLDFNNQTVNGPVTYNYKTKYNERGFLYTKKETLDAIKGFLKNEE